MGQFKEIPPLESLGSSALCS